MTEAKKPEDVQRQQMKEAVREGLNDIAVSYTNGALKFTNVVADSWAQVIDAFDEFFLTNLSEDNPEVARNVIDARLSSVKRTQKQINDKVRELEQRRKKLGP